MAIRYVILLYLLTIVKTDTSSEQTKVNGTVDDEVTPTPDIGVVRVARHPKLYERVHPPHLDYASITQQHPQEIRYAQQQEVDSYVRAYRLQQEARRPAKTRKQSPNPQTILSGQYAKEAYGEQPKTENAQRNFKQNTYPSGNTLSDQQMKVADPKYSPPSSNKFPNGDKSHKATTATESNNQKLTAVREEKVHKKNYEVGEKFVDQDTDASEKRESRLYAGTEDLLKNTQYGTPLSANYLAKPMYVLANPQLQLDPKLFDQTFSYTLPENHKLRAEGFEPASKTDLDALSALLGKTPTDQLQGLNHILGQQVQNLQGSYGAVPDKQALVDFKQLAPQSEALVGLKDLVQNQPIADLVQQQQTNIGLADLVQQHQTNIGLADLVQQHQTNVGLADLVQQTQNSIGLKAQQHQTNIGLADLVQQHQTNVGLADLVQQTQNSIGLKAQQHQTNIGLADLVQQHQSTIGLEDLVQQTQTSIGLKDLVQQTQTVPEEQVYVQPEADIGLKDHTPIREEVADFANTQSKPNVKVETPQIDAQTKNYIDQQLQHARESKSVYGKDDENLQYAAQYAFGYKIRDYESGNDFGHEEIREGDVAKGRYHVLLPDGRLQNVEYWADPSGYHAKVTYSVANH